MVKLIAMDLDGTLLTEYNPDCSEEAIELITALVKKGIYVVPASGRQLPALMRIFSRVEGDLVYLSENGALVSYRGECLLKHAFPQDFAVELAAMVIGDPRCEVTISGEKTYYIAPKTQWFVDYFGTYMKNKVQIVASPEDVEEPIMKVAFFAKKPDQEAVTKKFTEQVDGRCQMMVSGTEWTDLVPHGISKGDALREIGQRLGIAPEDMAAFGDNENDRSMLEFVGQPYLMRKCNPSMEDIPAARVDRVEDELRRILETL